MSVRKADVALYVRIRSLARTKEDVRWVRRFSRMGEFSGLWLGLGGLGMAAARRRRAEWAQATVAVALAHGASSAVKHAVARRRPALEHLPHLISTPTGLSFPSSHATGSFAAAIAFSALLPAGPLYALATLMALSRVLLGVHYPTDIAAGAALGTAIGAAGRPACR